MIDLPVYYMPMPINAEGNGPADACELARVIHQVWDANCATICEAPTETLARLVADSINGHFAKYETTARDTA